MLNIFDVRNYLQQMTNAERALLNEVVVVMKLLLVMPATNSSAMRLVKAYYGSRENEPSIILILVLRVCVCMCVCL